jgi:hypothetical protein
MACNIMLCALSGWLGILHGYFPDRRIRTLIVCAVLACLIWLGHRWFRTWMMRAFLVLALVFGALGTLSGLDIQSSNRFIADKWQDPFVQRTHIALTRPVTPYYEIADECPIPYLFCFLKEGQE